MSDEEHPASHDSDLVGMTDVSSEKASRDFSFQTKNIGTHINLTSKEGNDRP